MLSMLSMLNRPFDATMAFVLFALPSFLPSAVPDITRVLGCYN